MPKSKETVAVVVAEKLDSCAEISNPTSKPTLRILAPLAQLGKASARAVMNSVGGLGLFLLGPHYSKVQEADYRKGEKMLQADGGFQQRVANSALDGLLELMERPELPGESAPDRLHFVMWLTDSTRNEASSPWKKFSSIFNHFHPDSVFVSQANDRGFAHDVADGRKWYNPQGTGFVEATYHGRIDQGSPQVGHFLTAVDIGRQPPLLEKLLHAPALGHELIGDDQGPIRQVVAGLTHGHERRLFGSAIQAATTGNRLEAHRLVELALPDLSDSGAEPGRVGNSRQDLLNTSYGLAFGRQIRDGAFSTRQQAADWLRSNVGKNAPSLPWNDPID